MAVIALVLPGILALSQLPILDAVNEIEARISALKSQHRGLLARALALDPIRWRAAPNSQALGFELAAKVDVLGLGGSAGSGKSDVALAIALGG